MFAINEKYFTDEIELNRLTGVPEGGVTQLYSSEGTETFHEAAPRV